MAKSTIKAETLPLSKAELVNDYRIAYRSRQAAILAHREVLIGKAGFGIFGDGKELPQLAISHSFKKGDWRSGYYRDQTWLFALNLLTIEQFFSQLYAETDTSLEPQSGGRNMPGHFSSRLIDKDGNWLPQVDMYNTAADLAPTASQMPRTVGLAYASVLYRKLDSLKQYSQFSHNGDEITWATIGNASTSEGMFWEAINAIGVLHAPAIITVYDDGYGISVPNQFQMVKENIYSILKGFERLPCPAIECDRGYDLYTTQAWNYSELLEIYKKASAIARQYHIPSLVHVTEATQPLGHSTSGSQERYKSPERLAWEAEHDCIKRYREWIISNKVAAENEITRWEGEDKQEVTKAQKSAWQKFQAPILQKRDEVVGLLAQIPDNEEGKITSSKSSLAETADPTYRTVASIGHDVLAATINSSSSGRQQLAEILDKLEKNRLATYNAFLFSTSASSPMNVEVKPAKFSAASPTVMGFEVINAAFDAALAREPRFIAFGEDVGKLGDVNQGFRGMQEKYGAYRVTDTGIREATILGEAIGLALRGLRPICEIQYLDYLLYALQIMSDDLSNLRWRTAGSQQAPVIIRTRGHRLQGIYHAGSPMAGVLNLIRGIHVLVPRNMTQAAGFYNTLLKGDDPALVIEVLNGYRLKERMPDNIGEFTLPLGVPEVIHPGKDVTLVTYGAMVRIAERAVELLSSVGIDVELIDVQSLLPFDIHGMILESIKKTSRVVFTDEDVPGGASAYMMQQVLDKQGAYQWLDSAPRTLSAAEHRPAYATDGDYYSKPNVETIFNMIYGMMHESDPKRFPKFD